MTITRYEMVRGDYDRHQMTEQDDGDYVLHTDHLAALAAEKAKREADTDLLFDAYKGLLVLFRVLDKAGLTAGADTTNALANAIVAKHPEFPARTALRATLAKHGSK